MGTAWVMRWGMGARAGRQAERHPAPRADPTAPGWPGWYPVRVTAQVRAMIEEAKRLTPDERAELADALKAIDARTTAADLIGLFADQPEIVDEAMAHVERQRASWHLHARP